MSKNMIDIEEFTYNLKGYVERMIQIRSLSSPEVLGISNAEAYSAVLLENFKNIGVMAEKNRELINDIINQILSSGEPLDPKVIKAVEKLNEELLDASEVEMIDLPLATLLTDRLLQDADMKEDIDYRIKMLDKEIRDFADARVKYQEAAQKARDSYTEAKSLVSSAQKEVSSAKKDFEAAQLELKTG